MKIWLGLGVVSLLGGCNLSSYERDKAAHLLVGGAVSHVVTQKTGDAWKGCAAAFAVGVAKEAIDSRSNGTVDGYDIAATTVGCSVSWVF